MAFLVLLNGIPASGKSTVARAWVERHARDLPVAFDIDVLRAMIGGWQTSLRPAGEAARVMATAAIRAHLLTGRDVIVPQYARRADFVDELAALAGDAGAAFVELALRADPDESARRFATRAAVGPAVHGDLGGDLMADVHDELEAFLASRTDVRWVGGSDQDLERVLDEVDAAVAAAALGPISG